MDNQLLTGPRKDLLDLFKHRGECSIDEVTDLLPLAKSTVRQHLLVLERQRLIQRGFRKTGPGRPQLVYRLTQSGQSLYPSSEPQLLRSLIEHLTKAGHEDWVRDFFGEFWKQRRTRFLEILESTRKKDGLKARIDALRTLLDSEGFMPQIESDSKKNVTVRECNCPFSEAVRATQIPCKLESDFIRWALRVPTERTSYIPRGDSACVYATKRSSSG